MLLLQMSESDTQWHLACYVHVTVYSQILSGI